jgi:hypothetical protein
MARSRCDDAIQNPPTSQRFPVRTGIVFPDGIKQKLLLFPMRHAPLGFAIASTTTNGWPSDARKAML